MTDEAAKAIENAFQFEAKKDQMKQLQSGDWTLTLKVQPAEMPYGILTAAMGTRFMVAACEVNDDETATEQPAEAFETPEDEKEAMGAEPSGRDDLSADEIDQTGVSKTGTSRDVAQGPAQVAAPPVQVSASVATGRSRPSYPEQPEAAEEQGQASAKTGRPAIIGGPRQSVEAWRLCKTVMFKEFLLAEYPDVMQLVGPEASPEGHCAAAVYHICKTDTRSDFDRDGESRRHWMSLAQMYRHWRGIQELAAQDAQKRKGAGG